MLPHTLKRSGKYRISNGCDNHQVFYQNFLRYR